MPAHSLLTGNGFVKHDLADRLRIEIMNGSLPRGVRIVEGKWAQKFGVAQGSIREAINILALEGFVNKESGRSARVVHLTEKDVAQLYELRGALEGLAARLAAQMRPDLSKIQSAVDSMRDAANEGNCEALLQYDLQFHLELCELSGNPFIVEQSRRLLVPFFAFVRMRVAASRQTTSPWDKDLEAHQRIIDLVREAEGEVAEQYVKKAMARFAKTAYDNWENRTSHAG
ncbi:MAG TPA: GntR family transcriptional regulator [Candidatus Acidoferrum sp.]|jgi:DNA-binding GntR family transcriptional regulator